MMVNQLSMGILLAGMWACSVGAQTAHVSSRDSAGIKIITSSAASIPAWRLSPKPDVEITSSESDTALILGRIGPGPFRVGEFIAFGNLLRQPGKFSLPFPQHLLVYDLHGKFVRMIGRQGRGPGEFQGIPDTKVYPGDSLLIMDMSGIYSVMSIAGRFGRSYQINGEQMRNGFPTRAFSDGSVAITRVDMQPGTNLHNLLRYVRFGPTGDSLNLITPHLPLVGADLTAWPAEGMHTIAGHELFFAGGEQYDVRVYSDAGKLVRILRIDREPRRVTKADKERHEHDADSSAKLFHQPRMPRQDYPEHFPAIAGIIATAESELWLLEGSPRFPDEPQHWLIQSSDGRVLGSVSTPPELYVTDVGRDWVLGFVRVADGDPMIRMYRIQR